MYLLRISFICLLAVGMMVGCASKTAEIAETPATQEVNLTVGGLECGKCVNKVQVTLASLDGVSSANVSLPDLAAVIINPGKITTAQLTAAVAGAKSCCPSDFTAQVTE
ncbi:TPA: hypothetical protein EYN98_10600 [Candidatus Poribacteria bacterium]|jgi:copper chaperone CopZ|nr:hypothetical protein [Candidatus Poribacteria bacterium]HIA66490.1 hypothetical protein [Candidatus Poribacteria bacterium]HIB89927.1 hypothetical protein [Candidatus Poribacteria bacterium]HIC02209.1 hypothetical protein [Candidatus Poribacteria bacterium]HIN30286.1 hypothetical protein [Candidatus Poribacteria bacterium]